MARQKPTHHVAHPRTSLEANIYIASSLQQALESTDATTRLAARKSLCIRFSKACQQKYPNFSVPWINWEDLVITKIRDTAPNHEKPEPDDKHCCDNDSCTQCDIGYHNRCRDGCTL